VPYTLQPKPVPKKLINWALAPASLVGCCPLIQGEDPVTTLEYVSRLPGDINTFVPGTFGATTWQSWGINMNGGGVDGARGVGLPSTVLATMDDRMGAAIYGASRWKRWPDCILQCSCRFSAIHHSSISRGWHHHRSGNRRQFWAANVAADYGCRFA